MLMIPFNARFLTRKLKRKWSELRNTQNEFFLIPIRYFIGVLKYGNRTYSRRELIRFERKKIKKVIVKSHIKIPALFKGLLQTLFKSNLENPANSTSICKT